MKKWILAACLYIAASLNALSIVYVHLGPKIPGYLPAAITQARYFNPDSPIYLIANQAALGRIPDELKESRAILVPAESLPRTVAHETFRRLSRLDRTSRDGFWMFATERFFYLCALMQEKELTDVFHLEYDNMLYFDVSKTLPAFQEFYQGKIAATFDNDKRCIAGCMYISDTAPLERFLHFVATKSRLNFNDMEFLAEFKGMDDGAYIDNLPIVMPSYGSDRPLVSPHGHRAGRPEDYSKHFNELRLVFDAAALGQYLGGIDPRNGPSAPGFINESCVVNPSDFQYSWEADAEGRLVPMMAYKNEKYPIANLHIHSKNLKQFDSRRIHP